MNAPRQKKIRRHILITEEQDQFLTRVCEENGGNYAGLIRLAIDLHRDKLESQARANKKSKST